MGGLFTDGNPRMEKRIKQTRQCGRNAIMVKERVLDFANHINRTKRGTKGAITETDPEYRILEPVVSDEMADLGMFLELRKPKSADEVATLAGKPVERVSKLLAENRRFVPVGMGLMRVIPMLSPLLRKQESACL